MKATEQYFPVVLFIVLYKAVLTSEPVDEILKFDHSSRGVRPLIIIYKMKLGMFTILNFDVFTYRSERVNSLKSWSSG